MLTSLFTAFAVAVCASAALAPVTLQRSLDVALSAVHEAQAVGQLCSVAVNPYGLTAAQVFLRMDGAPLGTIELAFALGLTAKKFETDTLSLVGKSSENSSYFGIEFALPGTLFTPGGVWSQSEGIAVGVACGIPETGDVSLFHFIASRALISTSDVSKSLSDLPKQRAAGSFILLSEALSVATKGIYSSKTAVAVVDISGHLKVLVQADESSESAAVAAANKAKTTKFFDLPASSVLNGVSKAGGPAYGVQVSNKGLFATPGGSPLFASDNSTIIGAVAFVDDSIDISQADAVAAALSGEFSVTFSTPVPFLSVRRGITAVDAQVLVTKLVAARRQLNDSSPGVFVVRDLSGNLKNFFVEDGCEKGALDIALSSSRTAILLQLDSGILGKVSQPNSQLFNIETLFGGLVAFESGAVLFNDQNQIIGSIGISGTGNGKGTRNDGILASLAQKLATKSTDSCGRSTGRCYDVPSPVVDIDMSAFNKNSADVVGEGQAVGIIDAGLKYCSLNKQSACVSVFTSGLDLKALYCMDDSFLGAMDLTQRKAKTAAVFGKPNQALSQAQLPGGILYKVELTSGGLFTNAGGLPLKKDGYVAGAVGVAGAQNDDEAVQAAFQPWQARTF